MHCYTVRIKGEDMKDIVSSETIGEKILRVRGQKVMLDKDLAELYGVETGHLNRAVSRNMESSRSTIL